MVWIAGCLVPPNVTHSRQKKKKKKKKIHRHVAHAAMSCQQIRLELLVGNHSVGSNTDGAMLLAGGSLPANLNRGAGTALGQVQQLLTGSSAQDGVVLPSAWQNTLQEGSADIWHTDTLQQWVLQGQSGEGSVFKVQQDGRLEAAEAGVLPPLHLEWVPCCVVDVSEVLHPSFQQQQQQLHQQQQQQGAEERQGVQAPAAQQQLPEQSQQQVQQQQSQLGALLPPKSTVFLVGPWTDIKVDPSVWGLGFAVGVLQFKPKVAAQRLLQQHCGQHHHEGWVPGVGMRPRLWRNRLGAEAPQDGLLEIEAAQKRSFREMQQGSVSGSSHGAGSSSSQRFSDAALMAAYHAPWMDPPVARELPRQRAAAAAAVVTMQRQQQLQQQLQISSPVHDDLLDPVSQHMGPVDVSSYSWVAAYRRAGHKQLPRQLRVFGWRLLHAGVKVGARRMLSAARRAPSDFTCAAQQCQQPQQLETLTHLFLECPVAAAVWQWFAQLWQQVQPGAVVPVGSSRVLLLDDDSVWAPPADKQQLWTYMRLLLLESIWVVRSSCRATGPVGGSQDSGSQAGSGQTGAAATQGSDGAASQGEGADGAGDAHYTAKAVACRFRAQLQQQMRRDWRRVGVDVRLGSGIPLSWLRGPAPELTLLTFWRKWGSLFTVGEDGQVMVAVSTAGL